MSSPNESGGQESLPPPLPRSGWIAARARNASRRRWKIALVGGAAVLVTMLVLVFLPRGADRALRAELDRLGAPADTVSLLARLDSVAARAVARSRADSLSAGAVPVGAVPVGAVPVGAVPVGAVPVDAVSLDATLPDALTRDLPSRDARVAAETTMVPVTARRPTVAPLDPALRELQRLLQRARDVPLVESYRELAKAQALRADSRAIALADSIEALHQERDAYAALGGADARYAALTTTLAALGQRLVRIATFRLRAVQLPVAMPSSATEGGDVGAGTAPGARPDVVTDDANAAVAGALLRLQQEARAAERARDAAMDGALRSQLASARVANQQLTIRRRAIESRLSGRVPPLAVLLAALVVGASLGFASAVVRELRRPTVSDDAEAERLTGARVIAASTSVAGGAADRRRTRGVRSVRADATGAYPLVHLALTGIGEVARTVHVVAESRETAAIVAVQVGLIAAGESRAVALVEHTDAPPVLTPLLRARYGLATTAAGGVRTGRSEARDVITVALDRDVTIDIRRRGDDAAQETDAYDLTLVPQDAEAFARENGSTGADLVVCVRLAETPLEWLTAVVQQARARGRRIRAVLLWTDRPPGQ